MHDGKIIRYIRLLRGISQKGAGMEMSISQQAFAKLEMQPSVTEEKLHAILKALNATQKEFEDIKLLLYPPPGKNPKE